MFRNREFWCQADQLYFPCHKVIEQDIRVSITIEISYTDIQI